MINMARLAVQAGFKHGAGVMRNAFTPLSRKQQKLSIVKVGMTGLAIGLDKLGSGNGFMLNFRMTLLAFNLVVRDMVFVHEFGITEKLELFHL